MAGEKLYETDSVRMAEMARTHHMNVQRDEPGAPTPLAREADIQKALDSIEVKVREEQAAELGGEIAYDECALALRVSKNGTAPGLDGTPFELWKTLHARYVEDKRFEDRPTFDLVRLLTAAFEDIRLHGVDPQTSFAKG